MRTQVGIVGAGPAGLTLAQLLHREGIESVVLEARTQDYVEHRLRAGVLEQAIVDLLVEAGAGGRLQREGIVHHGIELQFDRERHRIPLTDLTGGRSIVIYGQTEIVKDLIRLRVDAALPLLFDVSDVSVDDLEGERPSIRFSHQGAAHVLDCDVIAGCDGFHGVCRPSIPSGVLSEFSREYSFGWLGILAAVPPSNDELVYSHHDRGFALLSLRSPELSRLYLQCRPDEDLAEWPDDRIWEELDRRLGNVNTGEIFDRGITPMRSFVAEPLRHGRLFLAGDAAHIVPPTGAKGLNLAVNDVRLLAAALQDHYATGSTDGLDRYSDHALRRVWRAQDFSNFMTQLLHDLGEGPFARRLQRARLEYIERSPAAVEPEVFGGHLPQARSDSFESLCLMEESLSPRQKRRRAGR